MARGLVLAQHLAQVLGIQIPGQRRGADDATEQHAELTALGLGGRQQKASWRIGSRLATRHLWLRAPRPAAPRRGGTRCPRPDEKRAVATNGTQ
jgi:hypothetical protein